MAVRELPKGKAHGVRSMQDEHSWEVRQAGPDRPCATGGTLIYHISISDILGWRGPDGEGNFNAAPGAQPQIASH
jgi:hypothetical protein